MKRKFYGGPLDGEWREPRPRLEGPPNPAGHNVNHLFTRGGLDHWYYQAQDWTGKTYYQWHKSGPMPLRLKRDDDPEIEVIGG